MLSKWGKKAIAGFLSLSMVATAVPFSTITAKADNEDTAARRVEEILHFSFDDLQEGLKSNGYSATVNGSGVTVNEDSKAYGSSLAFGNSSFLRVENEAGKSPLTGLETATVSYYSKATASASGWSYFAVRADETPEYLNREHYVGVLDKTNVLKAERHNVNENGSRQAAADAGSRATADWKKITVVYDVEETRLYMNDELIATANNKEDLREILTDDSSFYIGKGNWGGGEYFVGNIDEFSVYSGAMTTEEVAAKYAAEQAEFNYVSQVREVAHFTFDGAAGFESNGYSANLNGATETRDAAFNKALSFEGQSYVKIADANGVSPLTGLETATINYYSKPSNSGKGWTYFAVRDDETPKYEKSEHYIGVLDKIDSIRAERHNVNNCKRQNDAVQNGMNNDSWKMVTVVYDSEQTLVYVNGELLVTADNSESLTDILLENSVLYLGKANWEGGEYYNGLIDEFTVYGGAMTARDVKDKYASDVKAFAVSDDAKFEMGVEDLGIVNASSIKGNITLPAKTTSGASVSWTSSNPAVISDKAVAVEGYDDMPAGVVTRGDEDVTVTLTANISDGERFAQKTFDCTVVKKPEEKKLENYLFAFFPSNSEEQLYMAAGKDHLHFTDLNDGNPVLTSEIGDKGVRDPYIFRAKEGDHFYMIATDLKVQTTGWSVAQYGGSLRLLVWESDDLVNWSKPRLAEVGLNASDFEALGKVGCLWAPEAIYDEKTGEYVVFWASMTSNEGESHQVTYYSKTRDFVNFTTAKKFIDRGSKQHCIDTSMVEVDGKYYRVSADTVANGGQDSEIIIETSDSVLGQWTRLCKMDDLAGGMANYDAYYKENPVRFVGGVVEGPELFPLNDGKTWGLYTDNYGGVGYIPVTTTDISDVSGKSWTAYTKNQYNFGSLKKRHGSIMGITADEYKAVMTKWGSEVFVNDEEESVDPVLSYDFEALNSGVVADVSGNNRDGKALGKAKIVKDEEKGSVLYLDGSNGTYLELPTGFFDGRNKFTVSFDMKSELVSGNFFNFTLGKNDSRYLYLRARDNATYLAITKSSWGAEEGITANTASVANKWVNYNVVVDEGKMSLYIDGELAVQRDINNRILDFGKNVICYFGKSFYGADQYFKGSYDNIKVYNRALSEKEIAKNNGITLSQLKSISSENVVFVTQKLEDDVLTAYISKNNTKGDITKADLSFKLLDGVSIVSGEAESYDLTKDIMIKTTDGTEEKTYTIKSVMCNNPAIGGEFADPDIDCFNGKYYIYPTTDGFSGWSGYQFHVFSSDDLVNWKDEGVILDLKQDVNEEVLNTNGVAIAAVPWSDGSAWAPSIEEKDGKYYFYFCGNDKATNKKAIGVAVADSPVGPFTVADKPLVTMEICASANVPMGQTIDPSVFTDVDGTRYLAFGNGKAAIVKLNDDMMSIDASTMRPIEGLNEFRESVIINYRDGLYHFTWSCDDTGSENYHINYGTSESLTGKITFRGTILAKRPENDILGTGHHSILNVPGTDDWYIAYARFMTPLGQVSSGFGYHREVCLDKLTFGEDGLMEVVTPTNEGIQEAKYVPGFEPKPEEPEIKPEPEEPSVPATPVTPAAPTIVKKIVAAVAPVIEAVKPVVKAVVKVVKNIFKGIFGR